MRGEPDPNADPYRALGLEPGASTFEIKRAYRLLAKAFHPDSAGEAALPRFLAIHAAYEQLKTGRPVANPRAARAAPPPAAEPWRADPARARAARERARTARTRSSKADPSPGRTGTTGGTGSTASSGSAGRDGSAGPSGSAASTNGTGTSTGRGRATGKGGAGRRHERKATMGSTSYDEARDPSDATWSGASWYGPSSGEYWIVNPREYADPRKHGPEYQQRARRPAGDEAAGALGGSDATWASERSIGGDAGSGAASAAGPTPGAVPGSAASPVGPSGRTGRTATGTRDRPRAGSAWAARATEAAAGAGAPWDRLGDTAPDGVAMEDTSTQAGRWLGGPADDPIRRLGLALVAWPPMGLAAAALIGDVTGCSLYAAECTGSEPLLPWLAQAAILGLLLLLPPVTRLLAGGAVAVLLALVPITAFLVAVGGSGAPQAAPTLAVLLAVAWLLGIGWAATLRRREARAAP